MSGRRGETSLSQRPHSEHFRCECFERFASLLLIIFTVCRSCLFEDLAQFDLLGRTGAKIERVERRVRRRRGRVSEERQH